MLRKLGLDNCNHCTKKFKMEDKYYCPVVKKFLQSDYSGNKLKPKECNMPYRFDSED